MHYRAPWGTSVAVLTGIIAGGVAIWTVVAIAWGMRLASVPVVMPLVVLVWSWAYSPTGYRIAGGELLIERPIGTLRLDLRDLREVRLDPSLGAAIRVFGDGGLFGGWGIFWSRRMGWFRVYVRRSRPLVMVRTATRTVMVAPDRTEEFVRALGQPSMIMPPSTTSV